MTECKLLFEFLENSNIMELPDSLQDHLVTCDSCKEAWDNYCQMLSYCNSFPKIEISPVLYNKLVKIPRRVQKQKFFMAHGQPRRYRGLVAVAASMLFAVTVYFLAVTFEVPIMASHLPRTINKYSHKAYSQLVKAYNSRSLVLGNIQYMSLPISVKLREVFPDVVKNDQNVPKDSKSPNKEEKK